MSSLSKLEAVAAEIGAGGATISVSGAVTEVSPTFYKVSGLSRFVRLGECVMLPLAAGAQQAEVLRIEDSAVTVKPLQGKVEAGLGSRAVRAGPLALRPDPSWKGRVINALGQPIDGAGPLLQGGRTLAVDREAPNAMRRARVKTPMRTGVRAIDLFSPLCAGQRIGIFAGSGVGKSTLLAMLARAGGFDTVVVGLIGERGREVREFLDETLSASRSWAVTVVATGDESPMMRRLAAKSAMTVAEYFRDRGEAVLLIVDSVTRYAHAAREIALAAGEPAIARGYAPSVFTDLPKLLERSGPGEEGSGSITGIFSVLVDGDDHNDPVADSIRGTLDGHIVLDRAIADQGRYPAVNVLASVSRLAQHAWTADQRALAIKLRAMIARYEDTRDLRLMGGYQRGAEADLDQAVALVPKIYAALSQEPAARPSEDAFRELADALRPDERG
jgi:flagellum-specific ATP synthase